jgi:hypothetical protein
MNPTEICSASAADYSDMSQKDKLYFGPDWEQEKPRFANYSIHYALSSTVFLSGVIWLQESWTPVFTGVTTLLGRFISVSAWWSAGI